LVVSLTADSVLCLTLELLLLVEIFFASPVYVSKNI
jgi:hypothetical protein